MYTVFQIKLCILHSWIFHINFFLLFPFILFHTEVNEILLGPCYNYNCHFFKIILLYDFPTKIFLIMISLLVLNVHFLYLFNDKTRIGTS